MTDDLSQRVARLWAFSDELQFGPTPNAKLIGASNRELCAADIRAVIAEYERLLVYAEPRATLANGATWKARAELAEAKLKALVEAAQLALDTVLTVNHKDQRLILSSDAYHALEAAHDAASKSGEEPENG